MNRLIQISLDEFGRIVIPAALHEQLHLVPGMTLVVQKGEQGNVLLQVQSEPAVLVEKDGLLIARVTALSDLSNITRTVRDQRIFDLLQRVGL